MQVVATKGVGETEMSMDTKPIFKRPLDCRIVPITLVYWKPARVYAYTRHCCVVALEIKLFWVQLSMTV
jgi:hypothetical protein